MEKLKIIPEEKMLDLKVSLTWLISGAITAAIFMCTVGYQIASSNSKLEQIVVTVAKLEKKLEDRDMRYETLRDNLFAIQRITDSVAVRITALELVRQTSQK